MRHIKIKSVRILRHILVRCFCSDKKSFLEVIFRAAVPLLGFIFRCRKRKYIYGRALANCPGCYKQSTISIGCCRLLASSRILELFDRLWWGNSRGSNFSYDFVKVTFRVVYLPNVFLPSYSLPKIWKERRITFRRQEQRDRYFILTEQYIPFLFKKKRNTTCFAHRNAVSR